MTGVGGNSVSRCLKANVTERLRWPSLYDDAARAATIVPREASDRVCGKRLKAPLPILLPALERHGHLKLDAELRLKVLSMSAATIDRLLRTLRNAACPKSAARVVPEPRRRIPTRTLPTGTIRLPVAWEWIWSLIAGTSTAAVTSTAWF